MRARALLTAVAMLACAAAATSHHSIAGTYDFRERLTLEAVVIWFEFVNPHPFLTVDASRGSGKGERWRLEMDNRWELAELGFASGTLRPGDRLRLVVNPARAATGRGYVRRLERPADGFTYQHHD